MNLQKKKIFNFRPLFCVFISLICGIVFSRYILQSNYIYLGIFIFLLLSLLTFCIYRKKFKELLIILVAFACGLLFYVVEMKDYSPEPINGEQTIVARVSCSSSIKSRYQCVILDDVQINGESKNFNIMLVNYNTGNLFSDGDIITGNVTLSVAEIFNDENFNSSNYRHNVKYVTRASLGEFEIIGQNLHFNESVQESVRNQLDKFMTEENADISFAMMFGDKSEVSYEIKNSFSKSGIAHILAISGLHVGVLVGFLMWIFKKCKVNKYVNFGIISAFLILYCYLCSFSPSVVRASVMAIALMLAKLFGKRYDSLSAIGFAGILLILIKPLYVFDVGFQMSFACVIGIAVLSPTISKFLIKIKIPKFLAKPLALSISTQIALIPILTNCFGSFSILSVFLNVIIIPLFSIGYIIQFIFLPLTYITSFFGHFLYFTQLILEAIKISASFVASIPYTFISLFNLNFIIYLGYYATIYFASRMCLFNKKYKIASCISIMSLTTIASLIIYFC